MFKFLTIIIGLIGIHATYNLINFLRYSSIEKLLFGLYSSDIEIRDKSIASKNIILNYIKFANVSDKFIPFSQAVGYGFVANGQASVLHNIINNRQDIASSAYELLLEAKGNYWSRFVNSINPFYWLRIILFIPQYLLSYLGVKSDSIFIKIFQLLYWSISVIFTFAISVYPDEIKTVINSIFHTN